MSPVQYRICPQLCSASVHLAEMRRDEQREITTDLNQQMQPPRKLRNSFPCQGLEVLGLVAQAGVGGWQD